MQNLNIQYANKEEKNKTKIQNENSFCNILSSSLYSQIYILLN